MCARQARFPFLDESVIGTLLEIPLWEIAKLDEPVGKGDKKILREVCISFVLTLYVSCCTLCSDFHPPLLIQYL